MVEVPFLVLGFIRDVGGNIVGFGRSAKIHQTHHAPSVAQVWAMESSFQILDLNTILWARVFALQIPKISKNICNNTPVGNLNPSHEYPTYLQAGKLLSNEVIVMTDRLMWDDGDCWPSMFINREWLKNIIVDKGPRSVSRVGDFCGEDSDDE